MAPDGLGIIESAAETEALARSVPDSGGIIVVPAFAGLGAPYWDSAARGAIFGLTRSTTRAHLVRATLESIAHQVADLLDTLSTEQGIAPRELRVDGKACANDFLMQFQSDILGVAIDRPDNVDTTALGAAFLAGLGCGLWPNTRHLESLRRTERRFEPAISSETRRSLRTLWLRAVQRTLSHAPCTAESEGHGEQR